MYSLGQKPPDPVTPRPHLQMPSVWLWGIMFPSHEWILGHTQTRADSLLLVIFKVCGTPCPFATVCASFSKYPLSVVSLFLGPPSLHILCSKSAHLVQPKVFTCFPAELFVFDLDLVVCCVISSNSEYIRVKLACTQFTGEGREAPRVRLQWLVPSTWFQLPLSTRWYYFSLSVLIVCKKKKNVDNKLRIFIE